MSRIKIDDLPVAEDLTPEQEALIEGAGLKSFRPTLEDLERREMMDAGIGGALTTAPPPAELGHVRTLEAPPTRVEMPAATLSADQATAAKAEVLRLTNLERTSRGLQPLQLDDTLGRFAQAHSDLMASKQVLSHDLLPDGSVPTDGFSKRLNAAKLFDSWKGVDEIISNRQSPAAAVNGWMASTTGHREAILNADYTRVGVGVAYSSTGNPYFTQVFVKPWG
jgi:uncharacterized protein YkwD